MLRWKASPEQLKATENIAAFLVRDRLLLLVCLTGIDVTIFKPCTLVRSSLFAFSLGLHAETYQAPAQACTQLQPSTKKGLLDSAAEVQFGTQKWWALGVDMQHSFTLHVGMKASAIHTSCNGNLAELRHLGGPATAPASCSIHADGAALALTAELSAAR